jgi:hypothetical protein
MEAIHKLTEIVVEKKKKKSKLPLCKKSANKSKKKSKLPDQVEVTKKSEGKKRKKKQALEGPEPSRLAKSSLVVCLL